MNYQKNSYLEQQWNRAKLFSRLRLGLLKLKTRPYTIIPIVLSIFILSGIWKNKKIFALKIASQQLSSIYQYTLCILIVILPLTFLIGYIHFLGELSAKRDESCLISAFNPEELRNGYPLLMSYHKIKGTNVTVKEFHSNIPLDTWKANQSSICHSMNIYLVELEYAGKRKINSKRICLYTAPGRKRPERGVLYDDEL
jgi:hypothetical protein